MKMTKRQVGSLVAALKKDRASGMLLVAERLGAALSDQPELDRLSEVLTGSVPSDEHGRGMRTALLELLASAAAARLNLRRYRVR